MKQWPWKKLLLTMLVGLAAIVAISYWSIDVDLLRDHYPMVRERENKIEVQLQRKRPPGWVSLKQISPGARWAIVISEDWSFYQHQGVDLHQIQEALGEMLDASRFRGASTITQQTIKNVFLMNTWTPWRKLQELLLAPKIERSLTKDRILEVYLNVIEYGPHIYGISQAARHYFQKTPAELTPREGAFLAMLLPSPKRYYVSFKSRRLTSYASTRVKWILLKLRVAKVISPEDYERELQTRFNWEN